ncbi:uncharacterized protein LOC130725478 [Lotus japonicus]|uniref:uncharacterized protein LOC130725478 n=1 Tax=Lotus japonicus TaxID=34305 RepID=UPI00258E06B9|nr:uncharacterized protein LOC130725478 [Lotus japonicus]
MVFPTVASSASTCWFLLCGAAAQVHYSFSSGTGEPTVIDLLEVVLAIYGFPDDRNKHRTWGLIRHFRPGVDIPWLCIDDFNDILSPADKLGGDLPDMGRMQVATRACSDCDLHDVDFTGKRHTWSNNRPKLGTVQERLDYALVNSAWESLWPSNKENLRWPSSPSGASEERSNKGGPYGNYVAERELDSLLEQEDVWWKQRSRASWLKHGDRNTRFFHQKANQRRKRNLIEFLKDDRGRKVEEDPDIARVLGDYFAGLFTSSNPEGIEETTDLVVGRDSQSHLAVLGEPFTREEVEEALFQMHPT